MNISTGILSWVLLALLALTSAILCIAPPSLGGWLEVLYVGTVYGVLLGVYFVTCRGIRSAPRLIAFVVISAVAWPIAYFGSFEAAGHIPGGIVHHGDAVCVTTVEYYTPEENLEIVRAYLEKYPSSIP